MKPFDSSNAGAPRAAGDGDESPHYKPGDDASGPHCERRHYSKPWIIMRTDLFDDPRVLTVSELTGEKRVTVIGCLHRLWSLAGHHTTNGRFKWLTAEALDRLCEVPGFAKALEQVGWLKADDPWVSVPRFEKWMSGTAKRRALKNARQARTRQRKKERTGGGDRGRRGDESPHYKPGRTTTGVRGACVGAAAPTREDGDGETESETVRRVREKETRRRAETGAGDETAADAPAGFLSGLVRSDSEELKPEAQAKGITSHPSLALQASTDGTERQAKMDATQRRKIQGMGQLRLASDPELTRLRDELLALKRQHDENDPNTVNKLLILWIHQGLPASELAKIVRLAERYGRKRFAYAVGLAKKRIGGRLWEAY